MMDETCGVLVLSESCSHREGSADHENKCTERNAKIRDRAACWQPVLEHFLPGQHTLARLAACTVCLLEAGQQSDRRAF